MSGVLAFLHHLSAFALVSALAVKFVLLRDELNARTAGRLALPDAVVGIPAGILLGAGLLSNAAFIAKLAVLRGEGPALAQLIGVVLILVFAANIVR